MGRFTALAAATTALEKPTSRDFAPRDVSSVSSIGQASPSRVRRLTRRTLPDEDRYLRLREVGIHRPAGPLRSEAIARAALVQAHTRVLDEVADAKAARVVARYLYDEALVYGEVDEERALTRPSVDRWLFRDDVFSRRSQRTYRTILYSAGRTLYPHEFPEPHRQRGPRRKAVSAAELSLEAELYAVAANLRPVLRAQLLTILDLTTGAGLSSQEIRQLRGSDISPLELPEHTAVQIAVRKRGVVSRVVPVVCPVRGHRLLTRARDVGTGYVFPIVGDSMPRNAINHVAEELVEQGFSGFNAAALRNRWVVRLASDPGVPAAMLMKMAGIADLRVLHDLEADLPQFTPEDEARALLRSEGRYL